MNRYEKVHETNQDASGLASSAKIVNGLVVATGGSG